ncbi:uncharacterized protein EV154DRAFT_560063 [Mucor mucedo]|uniref:uncharacterized protein n=1 Tax=Mucor mucedo TaxID=29922 RepID=UPI00221F3272|nr:uncharacterized protein EV154DRAFT_560063 [Mucor mucedo]KAI7894698.1 hypothetical protein EV154DRAFT_560063 [Mucor mucedo]
MSVYYKNAGRRPHCPARKDQDLAKEFLGLIEGQKRKLNKENDDENEQAETPPNKYTPEEFLFIQSMSHPNKSKKWKKIFDVGLFGSYSSANSLKISYYRAVKRVKKQK